MNATELFGKLVWLRAWILKIEMTNLYWPPFKVLLLHNFSFTVIAFDKNGSNIKKTRNYGNNKNPYFWRQWSFCRVAVVWIYFCQLADLKKRRMRLATALSWSYLLRTCWLNIAICSTINLTLWNRFGLLTKFSSTLVPWMRDTLHIWGRSPQKKNVYFRALAKSGGGRPLPESFGPLFTKY